MTWTSKGELEKVTTRAKDLRAKLAGRKEKAEKAEAGDLPDLRKSLGGGVPRLAAAVPGCAEHGTAGGAVALAEAAPDLLAPRTAQPIPETGKENTKSKDSSMRGYKVDSQGRKTTFFITSIFFLVNTPRRLEMISLTCRYAQNRQIELLTLSGSIFVNSDKIQLWQHKVTPFK